MTLMELSIFPLDKGVSLSAYVARCLDVIDSSGLEYRLHSMGTVVEGDLSQLLDVLRQCFAVLQPDCERIYCTVKFDHREGNESRLESKLASVQAKLGRSLQM